MDINREHIDKVYTQHYSIYDRKMLDHYFDDQDLNKKSQEILKEQFDRLETGSDKTRELDHVFYKLYFTIHNRSGSGTKSHSRKFGFARVAAVLVVGLTITASLYFLNKPEVQGQEVEFVSDVGLRSRFKLPDGTTGWLGPESDLKFRFDGEQKRVATLDGLAYFDVVPDPKRAFVVKTPNCMGVEVVGTQFSVSSYKNEELTEVVLQRGSVLLTNDLGLKEKMSPNERVVYLNKTNQFNKTAVNAADFLGWMDGRLVLNDIPLREACSRLSRFYHVDLDFDAQNIDDEKVRLVLENESLDDALQLLSAIAPVDCRVVERKELADSRYSKRKVIITNKKEPM